MKINSKNRGFVKGTMVVMADGREKPIEQVRPGDYVLSFDEFNSSAELEPMRVLDTFERVDSNILEIVTENATLQVASGQMFIGPNNDWREVYNHSLIVDIDGNPVEYTANKINKGKHKIYDIIVDENHSLIANGLRVHNGVDGPGGDRVAAANASSGPMNPGRQGSVSAGTSGADYGGSCFVRGTKILMADGTTKNAEDVVVGDVLLGMDGSHNTVIELDCPALNYKREIPRLFGLNGSSAFVTAEHPFYSDRGWIAINAEEFAIMKHNMAHLGVTQMVVGDVLHLADGEKFIVESIDEYLDVDVEQQVFNYMLDGNNTYYADGFLAHNRSMESRGYGDRPSSNTSNNNRDAGRAQDRSSDRSFGGGGGDHGGNSLGGGNKTRGGGYDFAQTVNFGQQGRRKKNKRALRNQEPVAKPEPKSVSSKLIDSIFETAQVLNELITALDPLALTTSKISVQTGVDTMFSHANSFLATIFTAEMSTYDKMELISAIQNIMNATIATRKPFEETVVSASGKSTAMTQLAMVEVYCIKVKAILDAYTTKDTKGNMDVYVNNQPVAKKKKHQTSRRGSDGRYQSFSRVSGGGRDTSSSGNTERGSFGFADSGGSGAGSSVRSGGGGGSERTSNYTGGGGPSPTGGSPSESRAISSNNASERTSNYTGGGGPSPTSSDCHVPWAKVILADGSTKEIQHLQVGDQVLGANSINEVTSVLTPTLDSRLVSFNGVDYFVSETHPLLTDKGWGAFNTALLKSQKPTEYERVKADNNGQELVDIAEGTNLAYHDGNAMSFVPVKDVKYEARENYTVYRLSVTGDRTYIAENYVAHNK